MLKRELAKPLRACRCPGFVNFNDKYLFVLGGNVVDYGDRFHSECEMYDIAKDAWAKTPELRSQRAYFGSCTVQQTWIYVFCGTNSKRHENIERFDAKRYIETGSLGYESLVKWELIRIKSFQ